jgi:hypothetical protein
VATRVQLEPPGGADPVSAQQTSVVRLRNFMVDGDNSVLRALSHLAREGATGTLLIDISRGGIGTIRFRDEQKLPSP